MEQAPAITGHREALLRLVLVLFGVLGVAPGKLVEVVPGAVRLRVLRLLRPAEAAGRRLIVIAAQGVSVTPRAASMAPTQPISCGSQERVRAFPLFDPRLRVGAPRPVIAPGPGPRIGVPGFYEPDFPRESPAVIEPPVSARQLCRRLHSLQRALEDLPRQARRLLRLQAKRRLSPLRPGRPPGHRARPLHEIDRILADCDDLARYALHPPDT